VRSGKRRANSYSGSLNLEKTTVRSPSSIRSPKRSVTASNFWDSCTSNRQITALVSGSFSTIPELSVIDKISQNIVNCIQFLGLLHIESTNNCLSLGVFQYNSSALPLR